MVSEHLLNVLMWFLIGALPLVMIEISMTSYDAYHFQSGSWVKYEFYADTNATSQKYLSLVEETNQIEWIKNEIQKISGSNVTILRTTKFRNDTQISTTHSINVRTGEGLTLPVIIAPNLKLGDQIFAYASIYVYETSEFYLARLNITRSVNCALHEKTGPLGPEYYYEMTQFFWDKETGILCEVQTLIYELYEPPSQNEKIKEYTLWKMTLVEVSPSILKIWMVEDAPIIYGSLILFAALVFLIGIFLFWRKAKR